jgi:hypothetical protein
MTVPNCRNLQTLLNGKASALNADYYWFKSSGYQPVFMTWTVYFCLGSQEVEGGGLQIR